MDGLRTILGEGPNLAYLSYMANRLRECHRVLKKTGSLYLHCDPTMSHYLKVVMDALFGERNFRNEIVWGYKYGARSSQAFGRKHDLIMFYVKSKQAKFNSKAVRVPHESDSLARNYRKVDENGRRYREGTWKSGKVYRYYADEGRTCDDVWTDINSLHQADPERLGYPTQKPLALLNRIIRASSNEGDVVLDPFCGCGTTIHAAQNLGRRWIGIDVCVNACKVIQERLEGTFHKIWSNIEFVGIPKTIDDAKALAKHDPFKFEKWAASLTPGIEANKKQRGDGGIDGRGRLPIRKGVFIDIVSQVKAGRTSPGHVQAFNTARLQDGADMGIFTCFDDKVTDTMRNVAVNAGRFQKWPVLQIYTVEDYFAERKPDLPLAA